MIDYQLLGQVELTENGERLTEFRSQKEAALLIYLAHTGQTHAREFVAELLWESRSTKQSLSNLRTVLARLRKKTDDVLVVTRKTVGLTPERVAGVDSAVLLKALEAQSTISSVEEAAQLQDALHAYTGPFLNDFYLPDAQQFNEWVLITREHIRRQVVAAYGKLGQFFAAHGDCEAGIAVARRWLEVDPLDETANLLLLKLLLKEEKRGEAAAHYESYVRLMQRELGLAPSAAITAVIEQARPKRPLATPPPPNVTRPARHNLPADYDQFFGRKAVQQEIQVRMDQPWCRLVTLTGQGGVGKTRLAKTIARSRLNQYPDGVWLVELADLDPDDPELAETIAVEIAIVLDLRLTGGATPIEQLIEHLRHKQMLLVLDNFELLLDGLPLIEQMARQCEQVQLLVTSREALRLRAEWAVPLAGLAFPTSEADEVASEAVRLFMARQAQQRWEGISAAEQRAIRAICRRVEGLPLAIELAAALTQHASPEAIADGLAESFDLLETSLRDMPERHRALRVVFEMSWQTLPPALKQRLARLAIFRGGFTANAANKVTETKLNQLGVLVEKSLLTQQPALKRYRLHPVIRAYAGEKRPSADPTPHAHSEHFLTLLAQHAEPLQKKRPQDSMAVLEPDIDNVRLAWQTGLSAQNDTLLLPALPSLSIYYQLRGLAREGEAMMQETVKAAGGWGENGRLLATRAGLERGRFQNRLGQTRPAIQTLKATLKQAKQLNDRWAEGMAHVWWGEALWRLGEFAAAKEKLEAAMQLAHLLDDAAMRGWCEHQLGIVYDIEGYQNQALVHFNQAREIWQTLDHDQNLSNTLNSLGIVHIHRGERIDAKQVLEHALSLCETIGNRHVQATLLSNLSVIATELGDYNGAHYYLLLGLELSLKNGNQTSQAEIQDNLGNNYALMGNYESAMACLEQALSISQRIGEARLQTSALINLAKVNYEKGNRSQTENLYQQALLLARENGYQYLICEILLEMVNLWHELDRIRANEYREEAIALANVIQNPALIKRAEAMS